MTSESERPSSINGETTVVASDDVLVSEVDDELVLLDEVSEVYYGIDGVGVWIWNQLSEPRSVSELEDGVESNFDTTDEDYRLEVRQFLAELLEKNLVRRI